MTTTPLQRVKRTALQVMIAVAAAVPNVVALLDIPAELAAAVVGWSGALVVLLSAVHNALGEPQPGLSAVHRVARTVAQVAVAAAVAVPSALALIPDLDAAQITTATGIAGALVVFIGAVQNALEVNDPHDPPTRPPTALAPPRGGNP